MTDPANPLTKGVDLLGNRARIKSMKALILFVAWCVLLAINWPLALIVLVLLPFIWVISLPLRVVWITLAAVFALLRAVLFLPARLLGWRRG